LAIPGPIIETCANRGPTRDNPYYRGLGCAVFSERAIEQKSSAACRSPAMAGQGATRESRAPIFGAASSGQTCSLLRLPSGLLEEPGCTICEGFVPHIVRFGSVVKAPIFPKSHPIARIHFVFRIDQIL
jgi:hypothetical protein